MRKQQYSFKINPSLLDELEQYAQRKQTTVSDAIRQAIFSYLANDYRKSNDKVYDG